MSEPGRISFEGAGPPRSAVRRLRRSIGRGHPVRPELLTWQVRNIRTARYPGLRAIESVAISLPLFILVFAAVYFVTAHHVPASFSEGLSRTDALYLAVTVFSSVGFGDISPITQGAASSS